MIDPLHPLLLGSASPRRRRLLARVGMPLITRAVDVDETWQPGEPAGAYLERVVGAKLRAVEALPRGSEAALLVADTAVVCDGVVLGKPSCTEQARAMLEQLSGRAHEVSTRFAAADAAARGVCVVSQTVTTRVWFRTLSADHVARYAATGEGRDKAGAYAIQGIGSFAVERIEGSYSNVVGLPVCEVLSALEQLGQLVGFPWPSRAPASGPGLGPGPAGHAPADGRAAE